MQDRLDNFDLQIRSMLEDAEVKPSRRAWKGIASRLDSEAASAAASSFAWGRWAGAALAFASIAAGIFFIGSGRQESPAFRSNSRLVAEIPTEIVEFIPAPKGLNMLAARKIDAIEETGRAYALEENKGEEKVVISERASDNEKKSEKKISRTTEETADPFALMIAEDKDGRFKAGRMSLYAKGAIGGNDSDIRLSSNISSLAPGESSAGFSEQGPSTYGVPFSLGLGVRLYLGPKLAIGTGLDYSLLTRTFTGKYTGSGSSSSEAGTVHHALQYLGIPIDLYYDIISTDRLKFYTYAGIEAEYCLSNRYSLLSSPGITGSSPVKKLQWSTGLGLGVEFKLSNLLGLYIDPSLRYYFPGDQPKSIRTDKPVMVNFDAGLRFNF